MENRVEIESIMVESIQMQIVDCGDQLPQEETSSALLKFTKFTH